MTVDTTKNDFAIDPAQSRWKVAIAGILIMACIGNVYVWSVFMKPLEEFGIKLSWSTTAFQVAIAVFAVGVVVAQRLQQNYGSKLVAMLSACMMLMGFAGFKFCDGSEPGVAMAYAYIFFSCIGGLGMGMGYVTPLTCALKWYPDKTDQISWFILMGMGLGSLFGGVAGPSLIDDIGVYDTFLVFGLTFFVVMMVAAQFLEEVPEGFKAPEPIAMRLTDQQDSTTANTTKQGEEVVVVENAGESSTSRGGMTRDTGVINFTVREAVRENSFWQLWLVLFFATAGPLMLISQASPFGQDIVGFNSLGAGSIITLLGVFNAFGRPHFGLLAELSLGRRNVIFVAFLLQIIALAAIMPFAYEHELLYVFGMCLLGFAYGGFHGLLPSIAADFFGVGKDIGSIYALIYTAWGAAGIAGPQVAKSIVHSHDLEKDGVRSLDDLKDDWALCWYILAIASFVGMVIFFFTTPPKSQKVSVRFSNMDFTKTNKASGIKVAGVAGVAGKGKAMRNREKGGSQVGI